MGRSLVTVDVLYNKQVNHWFYLLTLVSLPCSGGKESPRATDQTTI